MSYNLDDLKQHVAKISVGQPDWLTSGQPVILYGAGNFGGDVLEILRAKSIAVAAFIDGKIKEPAERHGVVVYPLDHEKTAELAAKNHSVLITIHSHHFHLEEIPRLLRARGFTRVVTPMEIYEYFSRELGYRYWLAPASHYLENWSSYASGSEIWEDELSRETYRRILWYRLGRDLSAHPAPQIGNQYAPTDLPRWREPLRLLDGGACEGDAVKILLQSGYAIDRLHAWEPDLINYQKLAAYLHEHCPDLPSTLIPCGLGAEVAVVNFDGGRGTSSAISETGRDRLVVLPADIALANQPVSLVKLDIEGSELSALRGMRRLAEKNHPGMAICVYHRPDDMTDIPQLIRSWGLPYRFYLRSHAWNTFETVLYALPG